MNITCINTNHRQALEYAECKKKKTYYTAGAATMAAEKATKLTGKVYTVRVCGVCNEYHLNEK
jgi:hypothetical protein